jgi:hypothetical protein
MAGSRQYRRQSNGRFAGSGGGTVTTTGRAGGFASAAHRANVAGMRAAKAHRQALVRKGVKVAAASAAIGGATVLGSRLGSPTKTTNKGSLIATIAKGAKTVAAGKVK